MTSVVGIWPSLNLEHIQRIVSKAHSSMISVSDRWSMLITVIRTDIAWYHSFENIVPTNIHIIYSKSCQIAKHRTKIAHWIVSKGTFMGICSPKLSITNIESIPGRRLRPYASLCSFPGRAFRRRQWGHWSPANPGIHSHSSSSSAIRSLDAGKGSPYESVHVMMGNPRGVSPWNHPLHSILDTTSLKAFHFTVEPSFSGKFHWLPPDSEFDD